MVLIFNDTVSLKISWTNFTPTRAITYTYINYKYSALPRRISINIALKVGIFPEAEGLGKYSLPGVQYY